MMPNITRGGRMTGLLWYLAGPGRANEHTNPHIVAGDDNVLVMVDPGKELDRDDVLDVARVMDQPRKVYGTEVKTAKREWSAEEQKHVTVGHTDGHVWHCSLSLKADEGQLTDEAWQRIAESFVDRMGFVDPDGAKSSRWVAVRHGLSKNGNDHIHLVVQMVTEDGSKADVHFDYKRAQNAAREMEKEFGLAITEGASVGQSYRAEKPAERERRLRTGQTYETRAELRRRVRGAATGASTEAEFVSRLSSSGVIVRPRFATGTRNVIEGYSVALPTRGEKGELIFYAPSKLDKTLSLRAVRRGLGVDPMRGDPNAVGIWQEHHVSTKEPRGLRSTGISEHARERLRMGTVSVSELSRVLAAASLKFEKDAPGDIAKLAEQIGQVAQNPMSTGYMSRLMERASAKDSVDGWTAVLIQATRLSQALADGRFGNHRRTLARDVLTTTESVLSTYDGTPRTSASTAVLERPTVGSPSLERASGRVEGEPATGTSPERTFDDPRLQQIYDLRRTVGLTPSVPTESSPERPTRHHSGDSVKENTQEKET